MKKFNKLRAKLENEIWALNEQISDVATFPAETAEIQREEMRDLLAQLNEKRAQLDDLNEATATNKAG